MDMRNVAHIPSLSFPDSPAHERALRYFCLSCLGLMMALPFLQPVRVSPLTPFYSEWLAFALGLVAGMALLTRSFWETVVVPKIVLALLALLSLIAVQSVLIKPVYPAQALLPALYLAWAVLLAVLAAWLRERAGLKMVLRTLAYFILAGGVLHALIGIIQYLGLYGWFGGLVDSRIIVNITGNIGQQNHFATHLMLATLALAYLSSLGRMTWGLTIFLLALFTFVLALSGSRSVMLYALGTFALSFLAYRKTRDAQHCRLVWIGGLFLAFFLLYQYSLPWLNDGLKTVLDYFGLDIGHMEILTASQRGAVSGMEQRLVEWRKAWLMFLGSPLLGVGIGNYGWHSFMLHGLSDLAAASPKSQLSHHAHNTFLEILAELGIVGLLLLLFLLLTWLRQFLKHWGSLETWFIAVVLLTLFIHGNLEYPFWFSYFLGILAVFLALGDARTTRLTFTPALGQIGTLASLLLLFAIMAITLIGYRQLSNVNALILMQAPDQAARTLQAISMNPLLTPWAEATIAAHGGTDKNNIAQQVQLTTRVMRHQPDRVKVYRQIVYLALAGETDNALSLLRHSATAYAPVFPRYVCNLKKLPDKEILLLVAEGKKILGRNPACEDLDRPPNKSTPLTPSSDYSDRGDRPAEPVGARGATPKLKGQN